jgi:uncharacterized membrane protein
LTLVTVAGPLSLWWAVAAQNAMRDRIGMPLAGPHYWAVTLLVAALLGLLGVALRALWRERRRAWKPAVAVAAAIAMLGPQSPVHASDFGARSDRPLEQSSAVRAVRVYADDTTGATLAERARVAADRLVAAGGLEKSRVVIAIPTGSGWVDPAAVEGFERRFRGDVATVAVQYAATPSWFAYLFNRDVAEASAAALFDAVADRIETLPEQDRPDLHVYGESLGAVAGQAIFDKAGESERVCSVLWVGSPGGITAGLPREATLANDDDPVVHATPDLMVRPTVEGRPWLPAVSYLHAGLDLVGSLTVPAGSGHRYGPSQADALPTC